jgi:hypothetical protein
MSNLTETFTLFRASNGARVRLARVHISPVPDFGVPLAYWE